MFLSHIEESGDLSEVHLARSPGVVSDFGERDGAAPAGEIPFKIVSKLPDPGEQSGIAVVRRPAVSPYTAKLAAVSARAVM